MRVANRRGRPKASKTKQALAARYDPEVIAAFKSTGQAANTHERGA